MAEEHGTVQGVSIHHPSVVDAVRNMTKDRRKVEDIQKITGLPPEAIKQVQSELGIKDTA
jgi:hypothetical protein